MEQELTHVDAEPREELGGELLLVLEAPGSANEALLRLARRLEGADNPPVLVPWLTQPVGGGVWCCIGGV